MNTARAIGVTVWHHSKSGLTGRTRKWRILAEISRS
jgi:hypothetical protein